MGTDGPGAAPASPPTCCERPAVHAAVHPPPVCSHHLLQRVARMWAQYTIAIVIFESAWPDTTSFLAPGDISGLQAKLL